MNYCSVVTVSYALERVPVSEWKSVTIVSWLTFAQRSHSLLSFQAIFRIYHVMFYLCPYLAESREKSFGQKIPVNFLKF